MKPLLLSLIVCATVASAAVVLSIDGPANVARVEELKQTNPKTWWHTAWSDLQTDDLPDYTQHQKRIDRFLAIDLNGDRIINGLDLQIMLSNGGYTGLDLARLLGVWDWEVVFDNVIGSGMPYVGYPDPSPEPENGYPLAMRYRVNGGGYVYTKKTYAVTLTVKLDAGTPELAEAELARISKVLADSELVATIDYTEIQEPGGVE